MSAKLPVDILFEKVVEKGLCTRCGTCAGVCPTGNIYIDDPLGSALPAALDKCNSCGLCLAGCPGERVEFLDLEQGLFGSRHSHPLLGVVEHAFLSYAEDPSTRHAGASGGIATALSLFLLGENRTDGSVLFAPDHSEPWRGIGKIARSAAEIIEAAQSRYQLSPMNTVLNSLAERKGRYAYVGLPCHVHGLRKLQAAGWHTQAEIDPVIGIYCGNNLYFEATRAILRKLGIRSIDDLGSLSYREGAWPGRFSATLKNGKKKEISKLDFNQAIPFYINHRCLTCIDLTNELSDISIGDGWAKEDKGDEGWSIVLTRSERGTRLITEAADRGIINIEEISMEEAAAMHSHAFDLKKKGAFIRLELWKKWGLAVPSYDRTSPDLGISRKIAEFFISLQFKLCSSRFGRMIFRILPLGATGGFFRLLRKVWMKRSR
jgi:coenzyme F420 hydrogenase subunit beta